MVVLSVQAWGLVNNENKWDGQMKIIFTQSSDGGFIYIVLTCFVGNGNDEIISSGCEIYAQFSY